MRKKWFLWLFGYRINRFQLFLYARYRDVKVDKLLVETPGVLSDQISMLKGVPIVPGGRAI